MVLPPPALPSRETMMNWKTIKGRQPPKAQRRLSQSVKAQRRLSQAASKSGHWGAARRQWWFPSPCHLDSAHLPPFSVSLHAPSSCASSRQSFDRAVRKPCFLSVRQPQSPEPRLTQSPAIPQPPRPSHTRLLHPTSLKSLGSCQAATCQRATCAAPIEKK